MYRKFKHFSPYSLAFIDNSICTTRLYISKYMLLYIVIRTIYFAWQNPVANQSSIYKSIYFSIYSEDIQKECLRTCRLYEIICVNLRNTKRKIYSL